MIKDITLRCQDQDGLFLRTINETDIEQLRVWKNEHKQYFFHQDIIDTEQQKKWFEKYLSTKDDFMFMILFDDVNIGCMGFRLLDGVADIYNVILGRKKYKGKGVMRDSLRTMVEFIASKFTKNITAKVLLSNANIEWYKKNGFRIVDTTPTYFLIRYMTLENG